MEITVNLSGGREGYEARSYAPGETIEGTVLVYPDKDVNCRKLVARLIWHTEGRGTQYKEIIEERELYQGEIRGGFPSNYTFSFVLPMEPWSYSGHYVSVVWKIEAQMDLSWSRDPKGEAMFVLRPSLQPDPYN